MKIIEMTRESLYRALDNGNVRTIKNISIDKAVMLSMVGCIDSAGNRFLVDIKG